MPRASPAPLTIPPSSASPELRVIAFWVADQCLTKCAPCMTQPPLVERRVSGHPAKSVSTYTRSGAPASCQAKQ
eukprot:4261023-Lingulodinium_polyedra.AAC.1